MKTVLEIKVNVENVTEIRGAKGLVRLIYFGGRADCGVFTGTIMPGGVDTQTVLNGEETALSARYVLTGRDYAGNECKIFIENNGTEKDGKIITEPIIFTDSPKLKYLESAALTGTVVPVSGGLMVKIFIQD